MNGFTNYAKTAIFIATLFRKTLCFKLISRFFDPTVCDTGTSVIVSKKYSRRVDVGHRKSKIPEGETFSGFNGRKLIEAQFFARWRCLSAKIFLSYLCTIIIEESYKGVFGWDFPDIINSTQAYFQEDLRGKCSREHLRKITFLGALEGWNTNTYVFQGSFWETL